jgi:VIT1/CCC1 family predicted Fe2+/Mn2+ transporter
MYDDPRSVCCDSSRLTVLGAVAAKVGGAAAWIGATCVAFWGALAIAVSAGAGGLFHIAA